MIGSVVARAIGNSEVKQALFAEIAAPAIVVSGLAGATDSKSIANLQTQSGQQPVPGRTNLEFISSAWAQQSTAAPPVNLLCYTLILETEGSIPINGAITVWAAIPGESSERNVFSISGQLNTQVYGFDVPREATQLRLDTPQHLPITVPVSPTENLISLVLRPRTSAVNDFVWALGGTREFNVGGVAARVGNTNNVINKLGQIWGGPNSVINNPGQILGGPNSAIRNLRCVFGC
jgi:hypothetical protein